MQKIPTIFVRDMSKQPALVVNIPSPGCEWVFAGEGMATRKWDGTSCLVRDGLLYKRRELRPGDIAPPNFEPLGTDENTGKTVGWVPVGDSPDDKWHRAAFTATPPNGTYELVGPKVNGGKDKFLEHQLIAHGAGGALDAPTSYDELRAWLTTRYMEGVVWHHADGRMAKIKRRDFGLSW